MPNIKTIDGITANVAWTEELNADFTSLSTQSFDHNDTFVLGGATWLVQEKNGTTAGTVLGVVEAVAGSGIKITPAAAGTNIWQGVDCPLVSAKLADVCSSLSDDDVICVQYFFNEAVPIDANYDGYGGLIYEESTDGSLEDVTSWLQYTNFHFTSAGAPSADRAIKVGSFYQTEAWTAAGSVYTPKYIEIAYSFMANYGLMAQSTSTSTDPAPFDADKNTGYCLTNGTSEQPSRAGSFTAPTRNISAADARCGFGVFKVDSATSFYVFLERIRILRAGGSAGGLG